MPENVAFGGDDSLAAQTEPLIVRYLEHVDGMRVDTIINFIHGGATDFEGACCGQRR